MSEDGSSLVLFRPLPAAIRLSAEEKRRVRAFTRTLSERVAGRRPFTCLITNDAELQTLNQKFLGHDYPTDVLSFPAGNGGTELGEIAISAERAEAQARALGHDRADEIRILMLHGVLHLTGLDHERDRGEASPADSVEHIEALITAGAEEGILEELDRKLIHSVVAFGDKSVREVMTPRPNIVAISADKSLEDLRQLVIHEQYSRIPVYQDTIDNVIGFVHVRDMFELDPEERQAKTLTDLMRPAPLVPETKPVADLLREMQRDGSHLVIVVDEYGNTAGLATMEDLVEEILGEIRDEHEPDRDVRQEAEHVFLAPGSLDVDRLHDLFGFRPEDETESTTVGGLVAEWLGHVPQVGEAVEHGGIRIEVLSGNERRVDQVRISRVGIPSPVGANL